MRSVSEHNLFWSVWSHTRPIYTVVLRHPGLPVGWNRSDGSQWKNWVKDHRYYLIFWKKKNSFRVFSFAHYYSIKNLIYFLSFFYHTPLCIFSIFSPEGNDLSFSLTRSDRAQIEFSHLSHVSQVFSLQLL